LRWPHWPRSETAGPIAFQEPRSPGFNWGPGASGLVAPLLLASLCYCVAEPMTVPVAPLARRHFGGSAGQTAWILTGFLIVSAMFTPLFGRVGQRFGDRSVLLFCLVVFSVAGLAAPAAPNLLLLAGIRGVQGLGAGILPASLAVLRDQLPPPQRRLAVALLAAIIGGNGGVGFLLSGTMLQFFDWRVPIAVDAAAGLVATALVLAWVPRAPRIPTPEARPPLDILGAALLGGALMVLLLGLTAAGSWGWASASALSLVAVALVLLAGWWVIERRAADPIVDLRILRAPAVCWSMVAALAAGSAMFGGYTLVSQRMETLPRGGAGAAGSVVDGIPTGPLLAGLCLLPASVAALAVAPGAAGASRRLGLRLVVAAGLVWIAGAGAGLALLPWSPPTVAVCMLVLGVGLGLTLGAVQTVLVERMPRKLVPVVMSLTLIVLNVGAALGAQVGAALLGSTGPVPAPAGYLRAFLMMAVVSGLAAAATAVFLRGSPEIRAVSRITEDPP
jgi:MFS family permease